MMLFGFNIIQLIPIILFWVIGFAIDRQLAQLASLRRRDGRENIYSFWSMFWHSAILAGMGWFFYLFCRENPAHPWLAPAGIAAGVLLTFVTGYVQYLQTGGKGSRVGFGDGKRDPLEAMVLIVTKISPFDYTSNALVIRFLVLVSCAFWLVAVLGIG